MARSDIIADSLTIIRNAYQAKKEEAIIPYSNLLLGLAKILKEENYIDNFAPLEEGKKKWIKVYLKYNNGRPALRGLKSISKPSLRIYAKAKDVPKVLEGKGLAILTTSKGLMTDSLARKEKVGGEIICYVW